MLKRVSCLFLILVMLVSVMGPASVFAAGEDGSIALISEDFSVDASGFTQVSGGVWTVEDGRYVLTAGNPDESKVLWEMSVNNTSVTGDFRLTTVMNVLGTSSSWDGAAVIFNYVDDNNYYAAIFNEGNDTGTNGIAKVQDGVKTEIADFIPRLVTTTAKNEDGTVNDADASGYAIDHNVEVLRIGSGITVKMDGDVIGTAEDSSFVVGKVGYGSLTGSAQFDDLVVTGNKQVDTDTQKPSAPGKPVAGINNTLQVKLAWEASTDNVGVKEYSIYRNSVLIATAKKAVYVDSTAEAGKKYTYYAEACDFFGNISDASETVSVSIPKKSIYFPFTQDTMDLAVSVDPLEFEWNLEWNQYSLTGGASLYYLVTACTYYPDQMATDGTLIKDRVLVHLRNVISGGKEPGCSGGGMNGSGIAQALNAVAIAKTIPEIWDQLTQSEKDKYTLLMEAVLVGAHWAYDDDNDFSTGIDQLGNHGKLWNPNMREGGIGAAIAARYFLGSAEACNDYLLNFDYDTFMAQITAAGFTNIINTFTRTEGSVIEQYTKDEFTYFSSTLDEMFKWEEALANNMYSNIVKTGTDDGLGYIAQGAGGLPNVGQPGMANEFDSVDANGTRSSLSYVYNAWLNSISNYYTVVYFGDFEDGSEAERQNIMYRMQIGTTDFFYKGVQGYHGYQKGEDEGVVYLTGGRFQILKELWTNVIDNPVKAVNEVNRASGFAKVRKALLSKKLCIPLGAYNALPSEAAKGHVIQAVIDHKPAGGYANKTDILTVFDAEVVKQKNSSAIEETTRQH